LIILDDIMELFPMKQFLTTLFVCGATFAQTKSTTAAKSAPATKSTTVAKKAPAAAPARNLLDPSTLKAKAPESFKAKFTTTQGDFVIQVTRAWAPIGADRFYNLVRGKFFDGAAFFRVIPGFMAQFGISPDPKVSAVWNSQNLQDEPVKESNKRGFVTYAKSGAPNSRTTQLFINYADNSRLDADGFTPFGEVIEGMDVVEKFYSGYGGSPDQSALQQLGKPWIEKNMPKVDSIKTAMIVLAVAPAATKAAPKATTAPKSTTAPKATTALKSTTATKAPATKSTTATKQ
jgi:peptidyl-prolyl cis-trans isomerase A (cyclophilin A)